MKETIKRTPFVFFVILSLVVAISSTYAVYYFIVLQTVGSINNEEVLQHNEQVAVSASSYFDSKLEKQISTLIGIEVAHHNIELDGTTFDDEYYETILNQNEYISSIEILDLSGIVIYSSRENINRQGIDLSSYPIIENADTLHTLYIGGLTYDTTIDTMTLEVVYVGEDIYLLSTISTEYFDLYYSDFKNSFGSKNILILNDKGIVIFDNVKQNHLIQYHYSDYDLIIDKSEENSTFESEIYGENSIVTVAHLENGDWHLWLYEDVDSALSLSQTINSYVAVLFSFVVAIFATIYLVFDYIMIRELSNLGRNLEIVGTGKFEPIQDTMSFKEIIDVRGKFNDMNLQLKDITLKLSNAAYHDNLTGLPTKNKANLDFDKWYESSESISFLYLDISRFSMINDNYGFDVGDYCLKEISAILLTIFDYVYRVEGDEFLCLLKNDDFKSIEVKTDKLYSRLHKGISINDYQYSIPFTMGLSVYPKDGDKFFELMKKSVIAMNESKNLNDGYLTVFRDEYSIQYLRMARIELLIRNAIKNKEIYTVYQPIITIKDRKIRGFEALSRWKNDELGVVNPDEFIPILERIGLINQLDEMVINNAIKLNKYLCDYYKTKFVMSVNLSVTTIMSDRFVTIIEEAIERFSYDPTLLELEITESTIISDFDLITEKMNHLKRRGVKFSEDDFGDGFSSLTYLSRLRLDTLKISKNFLSSILSNLESRVLVQTILELSKRLGFYTIVEGVEDEETLDIFEMFGCDYVQGYLFYKPMQMEKILQLVQKEKE